MKTLYLPRHAKSSWADAGVGDHDWPLAPRGQRAAQKMVKHLRQHGVSPATVLWASFARLSPPG